MRQVRLGGTGLRVSRLGLGTDILHAGGVSQSQATDIVLRAWELGINFIDTDRGYDVFPGLAGALRHMERSRLVLASKTYEKTRAGALKDVRHALEALPVGHIDLFLLHAIDSVEEYTARAGALQGLEEARDNGWIGHIGLSTHTVPMVRAAADRPEIEAILTVLNLTGKNMKYTGSRQEMEQAIRRRHEAGQGVYIMKPFARGRLFDDTKWDVPLRASEVRQALTYLYDLPFIHAIVPGMRSVGQVEQNVAIAEELEAEAAQRAAGD